MAKQKIETEPTQKQEIKRIKVKTFLTGSYGVYFTNQVLNIPEDLDIATATLFLNNKNAELM